MSEREQHKNRRRKVSSRSPGVGGTEHDPLPFAQRYRRALDNAQLRRNLLNFQRSWGVSREGAFAAYNENPGRVEMQPLATDEAHLHLPLARGTVEFAEMRDRLAAIKD